MALLDDEDNLYLNPLEVTPPSSGESTTTPTPQKDALKQLFLSKLQAAQNMQSPEYVDRQAGRREERGNAMDRNTLAAALMKSANMVGAFNGKVADSSATDAAAKQFNTGLAGADQVQSHQEALDDKQNESILEKGLAQQQKDDILKQTLLQRQAEAEKDRQARADRLADTLDSREFQASEGAKTRAAMAAAGAANKSDKKDADYQKYLDGEQGKLSAEVIGGGRNNKNLTDLNNKIIKAESAQKVLLESGGNPNKLESFTAAGDFASMVKNGVVSEAEIQAAIPSSFRGTISDFLSSVTNAPRGRDQQEFAKNLYDHLQAQKALALEQKRSIVEKYAKFSHPALLKERPDVVKEIASQPLEMAQGLGEHLPTGAFVRPGTEPGTGEGGTAIAAPSGPSPQDKAALQWVNDPANASDPHFGDVKAKLQKQGLL